MTAHCPICGTKWDVEDTVYSFILRNGDEHDIYCAYCGTTITFVLSWEHTKMSRAWQSRRYEDIVKNLERQLKKEKEKNNE